MKKLLLSVVLSFVAVAGAAQVKGFGYGPRVGVNLADYTNSPGSSRAGIYAGAFADYNFTHRWGIETGVYYSQLGSAQNVELGYANRTVHQFDYLSVPLVAKFNFLGGFRAFLGGEGLFLMSAHRKEKGSDGMRTKMDNVRSSNLALTFGAAYLFRCGLDISASYSKGLYSVRQDVVKSTNPTYFRVAVGWRFIGSK